MLKCPKFDFGWGSAPHPTGGANSASPDSLAGFLVVLLLRKKMGGKKEKTEGNRGGVKGEKER